MKRLVLLLAIVVIAVVIAFMGLPEDPGGMPTQPQTVEQPEKSEAEAEREARQAEIEAERDKRLKAMKKDYAKLERERRDLRIRLKEISYYMSQTELPDDQIETMRDEINDANRLLVNPPLLGAFRGPDDLSRELDKVARAHQQMDEFETIIRQHGGYEDE